jgi:hypothetical protein
MLPPGSVPPIEWLNDNSAAVQAIAVVVLVIVTAVYAKAARTQAKANVEMARQMREQRYAACFPLVDAVFLGFLERDSSEGLEEALAASAGQCPEVRRGYVQNFGLGPALDVEFYIKGPGMQPCLWKVGALAVGQVTPAPPDTNQGLLVWLQPIEGTEQSRILRIHYRDVYGRQIESTRRVTADRDEQKLRTEALYIIIGGNS